MALETYQAKRDFSRTPEPKGKRASQPDGASFVIQKHDATRLHYDFRLEMDGVLKSWAVTRGPSLNPDDKRLAVHVEDHPLEYGDFEGVIPKGQYGGGTVIVWDRGTWTPVTDPKKGLKKGHLEFELDGAKLRGRWHLVRMHPKEGESRDNWLLIKAEDEEARSKGDILKEEPNSAKTGRSLKEVAANPEGIWNSRPAGRQPKKAKARSDPPPATKPAPFHPEFPKRARKAAMPGFIEPALAKLKAKPPAGDRWIHEIKFDGYRTQVHLDNGKTRLLTRSGLDWTDRFGGPLTAAVTKLPVETAIIDGEIVVEATNGASDFSALQKDLSDGRSDRFRFYGFDLLHLNGYDLRATTLVERKALLGKMLDGCDPALAFSEHFETEGGRVLERACSLGLEGIVSKLGDSEYREGRSTNWIKTKCHHRQEFVIGGYTPSSTGSSAIGSLALGVYENGRLRHVGRVGTGFTVAVAEELFEMLSRLQTSKSPFADKLDALQRRDLLYVRPEFVGEVEFSAWSADGNLRHASFRGLRDDKPAKEIVRETARDIEKGPTLPNTTVKLTHPDRIYWPGDGVTKQGLANYYAEVWRFMEPFVVNRPLALLRCPEGIDGPRFFQKHAWRGINTNIVAITDPKDKAGEKYLKINDFDGLIALAQSAVLEIHPWGTTTEHWERPDMITMDLDPGDGVGWSDIVAAATELKDRLETAGLAAFVKTSGGKGLHVVAPLKPKATWRQVKAFTKALADTMSKDTPTRYLSTATKAKRDGRIFIDYLRNGRGNTAVCAYSTRARPGAPVSMPLDWSDLGEDIGPAHFTLNNVATHLQKRSTDPWGEFFAAARPLA
ncbi:DNA ligase D [Rhizobiaceae bacterium n13]|uniref:DNA ligase (ATP) n=1 Tax=Ferirhizobium litorale TaxID=2927786 RepID=A0AAE3U1N0_9HYPH|nr:DNA ligase D [Fererhizobium litorale]MDI7862097.1 DNA ligase D [Fererhizobium litorale]MDI7922631.1 DNA ligase D [Fererhizobium litorale]